MFLFIFRRSAKTCENVVVYATIHARTFAEAEQMMHDRFPGEPVSSFSIRRVGNRLRGTPGGIITYRRYGDPLVVVRQPENVTSAPVDDES